MKGNVFFLQHWMLVKLNWSFFCHLIWVKNCQTWQQFCTRALLLFLKWNEFVLYCWIEHNCAQCSQSIMSSEGSHRRLLHYAYVETDRDWCFSSSCDLFIKMKTSFSHNGPSLHIITSAAFEAFSQHLRHTLCFSSSIFFESHLWSWSCIFFSFVAVISMPSSVSPINLVESCLFLFFHSFSLLSFWPQQSDFIAVVLLCLMSYFNGRQSRCTVGTTTTFSSY